MVVGIASKATKGKEETKSPDTVRVRVRLGTQGQGDWDFLAGRTIADIIPDLVIPPGLDRIVINGAYNEPEVFGSKRRLTFGMSLHFTTLVPISIKDVNGHWIRWDLPVLGIPLNELPRAAQTASGLTILKDRVLVEGREVSKKVIANTVVEADKHYGVIDP